MYVSPFTPGKALGKTNRFTLTLLLICLITSCSSRITIPKIDQTYPNGIGSDDTANFVKQTTNGATPRQLSSEEQAGDKLRDYVQAKYIVAIRKKANYSDRFSKRSGAVTTGIGVIGAGVSGLISENKHQKYLTLSISTILTVTGILQVFSGVSGDYKLFLSDLENAITNWEVSAKNQDSYRSFRAAIGATMAKYGDLYEEAK